MWAKHFYTCFCVFQWSWIHCRGGECFSHGGLALGSQGEETLSSRVNSQTYIKFVLTFPIFFLLCIQITPIMGVVGLILMIFLCPNPARGAAETNGEGVVAESSYLEDIKYLLKK